jgi:hypothetical protein
LLPFGRTLSVRPFYFRLRMGRSRSGQAQRLACFGKRQSGILAAATEVKSACIRTTARKRKWSKAVDRVLGTVRCKRYAAEKVSIKSRREWCNSQHTLHTLATLPHAAVPSNSPAAF